MPGQFHSRTSSAVWHRRSPFRLTANLVENSGLWTFHWLVYNALFTLDDEKTSGFIDIFSWRAIGFVRRVKQFELIFFRRKTFCLTNGQFVQCSALMKPLKACPYGSEKPRKLFVIFSSSVSKNGEVYSPETSCMKETSVEIKNIWMKQLCNREVQVFSMALRPEKSPGLSKNGSRVTCLTSFMSLREFFIQNSSNLFVTNLRWSRLRSHIGSILLFKVNWFLV